MEKHKKKTARIEVAVFIGIVFGLSLFLYVPLYRGGSDVSQSLGLVVALMWIPTGAAGLTYAISSVRAQAGVFATAKRLIGSVRVLGLGGPGRRLQNIGRIAVAAVFPIGIAAIAYSIAWRSGLATFVSMTPGISPLRSLLGEIARAATVGTAFGTIIVLGEEIGWRGFFAARIAESSVPRPALFGGLVWACWHIPLIVTGHYAGGPSPIVAALAFALLAIALHTLWTGWYLRGGSLWPAIIGHSAWNTITARTCRGSPSLDGVGKRAVYWWHAISNSGPFRPQGE